MKPITLVSRTQRRGRRRATVVLALVVAVVGGLAIALVAGASRVGSVVDRYFAPATSYDVSEFGPPVPLEQVLAMPGVRGAMREVYVGGLATRSDGVPEVVNLFAIDAHPWNPMIRVRQGHLPTADETRSIAVNQQVLDDFGLQLGDELTMATFTEPDLRVIGEGGMQASGAKVVLRVTAVIDTPDDFLTDVVTGASQVTDRTGAFVPFGWYEQHVAAHDIADFGYGYEIDLDGPGSLDVFEKAFRDAAASLAGSGAAAQTGFDGELSFNPPAFSANRAILAAPANVESSVLLALGLTTALAGLVMIALMLAADERLHARQQSVLAAMGMTRTQRTLLSLRRALPAIGAGAVLAAVLAVAVSDRFPVGAARPLERDQGLDLNIAVVLGGAAVAAAMCALAAIGVGGLATRRRGSTPSRPARTSRLLAEANLPIEARVGGYLAFPGCGARRVVPAWQTVGAGVVAVATVVGVALYVIGIDHLRTDKAAHGFGWDVAIGNTNIPMEHDVRARLAADPRFAATTEASYGGATFNGQPAAAFVFGSAESGPGPTIVRGRSPRTPGEVALGEHLMERLGVGLGDTVRLSLAGSDQVDSTKPTTDLTLTVVGTTVVANINGGDFADVAAITMEGFRSAGTVKEPQLLLVRFRPGIDRAATVDDLIRSYPNWITTDLVPSKVQSFWQGRQLPVAGAIVLALFGAVLLSYALATTARLMRRELAVLRALGMRPRGARNAVVWQGLLLAAVVLVIGVPVGLVGGAAVWRAVAQQLGVSGHVRLSPWLLATVPVTALVAVLGAALPARRARHIGVAEALRVE